MAEILRGRPPNIGMRVLGLTASFSAGKAKSWDQISTDKKDMESLIGGSIFQPSLPSRAMLEWLPVAFVDGVPTNRISEEFGSDLKRVDHADIVKVGRSTEAVLYHLGRRAFLFAWDSHRSQLPARFSLNLKAKQKSIASGKPCSKTRIMSVS